MIRDFYDKDNNRRVLTEHEAIAEIKGEYPHLLTLVQGTATTLAVVLDKIAEYFDLEDDITLASGDHVFKGDVLKMTVTNGYAYVNGTKYNSGDTFRVPEGRDVQIISDALGYSQGNITYTLADVIKASGDTAALYATEINAVLAAAAGYVLPATIVVVADGVTLTVVDDYTYNPSTGAVKIFAAGITGAVSIAATGVDAEYGDITLTLTSLTATGDETAKHGEDIDITLSAAENYDLPSEIIVSIGGVVKTVATDYTYDSTTGAVHIAGANIIGAVAITGVADGEDQGAITYTLTNLTVTGDTNAYYGTDVEFTLAPADTFTLPETINITVDGDAITVIDDYSYDPATGAVLIGGASVTGAVVVTGAGASS